MRTHPKLVARMAGRSRTRPMRRGEQQACGAPRPEGGTGEGSHPFRDRVLLHAALVARGATRLAFFRQRESSVDSSAAEGRRGQREVAHDLYNEIHDYSWSPEWKNGLALQRNGRSNQAGTGSGSTTWDGRKATPRQRIARQRLRRGYSIRTESICTSCRRRVTNNPTFQASPNSMSRTLKMTGIYVADTGAGGARLTVCAPGSDEGGRRVDRTRTAASKTRR